MDKNRFETLKEIVNLDPNVHPIQSLVSVDDLKWLVQQAELVEELERVMEKDANFIMWLANKLNKS